MRIPSEILLGFASHCFAVRLALLAQDDTDGNDTDGSGDDAKKTSTMRECDGAKGLLLQAKEASQKSLPPRGRGTATAVEGACVTLRFS